MPKDPHSTLRIFPTRRARVAAAVVLLIVAGGAARMYQLDHRTITHPEFYVPSVELPDHVTQPPERFTTREVVQQALINDVHPPGYYLGMLYWSKIAGTSHFAIRLPSVVFGIVSLLLIFFYTRRVASTSAAVLATGLLAFHGLHVLWSQSARDWSLVGMLGLLSCWLLIRLAERWNGRHAAAYILATGLGVWVEYYFWPIFAAQICWLILRDRGDGRQWRVLNTQVIIAVLCAPMALYFVQHTGQPNHLSTVVWPFIVQMLQFGGALHPRAFGADLGGLAPMAGGVIAILGALALFTAARTEVDDDGDGSSPWPPVRWLLPALGAAAVVASGFVWIFFHETHAHRKIFAITLTLPWIISGLWIGLGRLHTLWSPWVQRVTSFSGFQALAARPALTFMALPFLALVVANLRSPVLVPYALVSFTPLFLAVMASGVDRWGRYRFAAVPVLAVLMALSLYHFTTEPRSNRDYQQLARAMMEKMSPEEPVLVVNDWYTAPVNYYFPPDRYRIMPLPDADDAAVAVEQLPDRVWVVGFGEDSLVGRELEQIGAKLTGFARIDSVRAFRAGANRYERRGAID